ncbi:pas domain s-box protein [Stylonychia lemnae]|uniref:histidine kinase n=1 Tax=Stylonychia lemnae TaxID=5949 RepID=A0A078ATE2_STYLE|nr:pas domain s-box protein [Stylonychia lemnae]|eukprot:CDW85484.1 pas domain s-box protein [Stylonychia lemnae]
MDSNFFLNIAKDNIRLNYQKERERDIVFICYAGLFIRYVTVIGSVASAIMNQRQYSGFQWVIKIVPTVWQTICITAAWKWPNYFAKYQVPFIVPSQCLSLFNITQESTLPQVAGNLTAHLIFMIIAFLMNYNWMVSGITMTISTFFTLVYYGVVLKFKDVQSISIVISVVIIQTYACYYYEKRLKLSFIRLQEIQTMNDELKQLFDNLPEGIVLFNQDDKNISIANQEFLRLFGSNSLQVQKSQEGSSLDQKYIISDDCLNKQILFECELEKDGNSDAIQDQYTQIKKDPLCILQTIDEKFRNRCFNILKAYDELSSPTCDNLMAANSDLYSFREEIVNFQHTTIHFKGKQNKLIIVKNLTPIMRYESLKVENHFYEMLTATVSHDMRTPLNAMIGLIDNLQLFVQDEEGLKYLNIIRNSAKFMSFLVNDLLDFFQIRNGKFNKNLDWVDIDKSIRDVIDLFKVGAEEKGILVVYESPLHLPNLLYTDESRVKQILLNLLQNSLKFTFQGKIKVRLDYFYENKQIMVTVSDTGIGIQKEDRKKLFTLFGKLEQSAKINTFGIGLGLSICKNIIELFDEGDIGFDPTYEKGSRFFFKLKAIYQIDNEDASSERILLQNEQSRQLSNYIAHSNNIRISIAPQPPGPYNFFSSRLSDQFNQNHDCSFKEDNLKNMF